MEWTICGLTAQPGEKVQGYFAGPDGEKTIPICLIPGQSRARRCCSQRESMPVSIPVRRQ